MLSRWGGTDTCSSFHAALRCALAPLTRHVHGHVHDAGVHDAGRCVLAVLYPPVQALGEVVPEVEHPPGLPSPHSAVGFFQVRVVLLRQTGHPVSLCTSKVGERERH